MDRDTAEPQVDELPGPRASERVARHADVAATSTYLYEFVWDVAAPAHGPFCTDADGNVLLDFTSHVGAAPLGYDNPKVTERMAGFDLPDPAKIAGQDFYTTHGDPGDADYPGPAELMERLVEVSSRYGLDAVFLSNSGAEAVENAIKICYDHTAGQYGIAFEGAFHGRTLGALSLNRSKAVYRRDYPEIPGIHDAPYCRDGDCTPATCSCGFFPAAEAPSQLRRMLDPDGGYVSAEDLAYVVVEPVQGEGGYYPPSDAFMDEVTAVVERHDVPLVADEIQSGVGRTGEFWASDHYAIEPDVIAGAKALRVGATVATEEVFPEERSRISSTWGAGDLVDSLQGALTIDAIHEHDLMANATRRGRQLRELLADADLDPVAEVRNLGLMFGVEFDTTERRDAVLAAAFARGLLTLPCGRKTLRLLPPLDVTEREIDIGFELLADSIREVA